MTPEHDHIELARLDARLTKTDESVHGLWEQLGKFRDDVVDLVGKSEHRLSRQIEALQRAPATISPGNLYSFLTVLVAFLALGGTIVSLALNPIRSDLEELRDARVEAIRKEAEDDRHQAAIDREDMIRELETAVQVGMIQARLDMITEEHRAHADEADHPFVVLAEQKGLAGRLQALEELVRQIDREGSRKRNEAREVQNP